MIDTGLAGDPFQIIFVIVIYKKNESNVDAIFVVLVWYSAQINYLVDFDSLGLFIVTMYTKGKQ